MKTYKVGLIRVLTTGDEELLQLHGKLIESYFPMFQVVSRCIPDQPEGIHDDETFAVGVPKVVNLAVKLWKEGCQAIIISCAGDPGVPEARQAVPIPVIGAGSSTAALSLFFGSHPAVLGITEQKEMGADVIALSCTGMSSIRIAPSIEKTVEIPVLDPVLCEGLLTLFELLRREIW